MAIYKASCPFCVCGDLKVSPTHKERIAGEDQMLCCFWNVYSVYVRVCVCVRVCVYVVCSHVYINIHCRYMYSVCNIYTTMYTYMYAWELLRAYV